MKRLKFMYRATESHVFIRLYVGIPEHTLAFSGDLVMTPDELAAFRDVAGGQEDNNEVQEYNTIISWHKE